MASIPVGERSGGPSSGGPSAGGPNAGGPNAGGPSGPLAAYVAATAAAANRSADIYAAAPPAIARAWESFATSLIAQGGGDPALVQAHVNRQVDDLGLAFRIAGDEAERSWPLGPMPIIIGPEEWRGLEAGLTQRARLIEAIVADIHGPQCLISEGHLPAAIVAGSANFVGRQVGLRPPAGQFSYVHAVDLARGPTGAWQVLADRVRLPIGIGYALENRMALARATGGLLPGIGTRRLSDFFEALRAGLAAACERSEPRIALLTPGRFHQSYPEQAHLARHLGFSLVEGRDLVVSEGRLYVRTIAGLKRIDALWRWINTRDIDPLAFDPRSGIGVPDLYSAWSQGTLVVANWPGVGVVESRAMTALLPRLSRHLLGEELALPSAATWWCGELEARAHVLSHLDELVIGSAFHTGVPGFGAAEDAGAGDNRHTRLGAQFSGRERKALAAAMERRPMDFAAQDIIHLSTTPCLIGARFEARPFTLRAYLARDANGQWVVMPGGFARVSTQGDLRNALMGAGDVSADVCVVEQPGAVAGAVVAPVALTSPALRRAEGLLPSQTADNLFWLGRYCERAQLTARVVRTLLATASREGPDAPGATVVPRLAGLLVRLDALASAPPEADEQAAAGSRAPASRTSAAQLAAPQLAAQALSGGASGSLTRLVDATRHIARLLRDRLTPDCWRVLNRPFTGLASPGGRMAAGTVLAGGAPPLDNEAMAAAADRALERFAAFHQLMADYMSRAPAWRFLEMGRALERASLAVQAVRETIPGSASADDLAALLDLFDAEFLYRSRYLTMPFIVPVLDLVLLDPAQPRSLAAQVQSLVRHLEALPVLGEDGLPEAPLRHARHLAALSAALEAADITAESLDELAAAIATLSDAITQRFFQQADRPDAAASASLQA